MSSNRILALSSSRVGSSGYLEAAAPLIEEFLPKTILNIAFIPFASVDLNHEEYLAKVKQGLACLKQAIHLVHGDNARSIVLQSDAIMVGGGNTFKLLHDIYRNRLLDAIRDKVNAGTPYIGWSAGSNITGLTIGTTNDMPIIEPESFNSLGLLPFQINPHYINVKAEGYNGETRDQRLEEFIKMNRGVPVVCLPEGTALRLEGHFLRFIGKSTGVLFQSQRTTNSFTRKEIEPDTDLSFLL